jgi:two-component system, cell cycle sensor histidine kinase and response regulator CckA
MEGRGEDRFRRMVEASEEVFFYEHDRDHRFTYVSPSAQQVLGYAPEELLGRPYDTLLMGRPSDRLVHERTHAALDTATRAGTYDVVVRHGRGDPIVLELVETPVVEDGEVVGLQGFGRDVTEQRRAEDRLLHVASTSPAVLYVLSVEGTGLRPQWVSANVTAVLGYPVDQVLDAEWWQLQVHPEDRAGVAAATATLFSTGRVAHEYRFRHRDGAYRWLRDHLRLLRDADGEVVEVVGSWMDTTDFRQLEHQLRQAQKMEAVGRLAGGIAHDFNNILTAVAGNAQFALEALPPSGPVHEDLKEIIRVAGRATELTRQLLAFSRRQVNDPRVLDLGEVMEAAERMLRRVITEDVRLEMSMAPGVGRVRADPAQLEQVLVNLALNARDAMPGGGRLLVDAVNLDLGDDAANPFSLPIPPGRYVRLAVSDTGEGMTPAVRERIFEPFFTTKEPGLGTGLGLSTVYGVVTQAGGHVLVYSEPGQGTTFKLYFPRTDEDPEPSTDGTAQPLDVSGTETILVVEDQESVRNVVRRALEDVGYRVLEAADGGEALAAYERHAGEVGLLLTDVVMPGMSGKELVRRARQLEPDLPVLYMSGYAEEHIARQGIVDADANLLEKPFDPVMLQRKVRAALDGWHGS